MATVIFTEPKITEEEKDKRWKQVRLVLKEIAYDLAEKGIELKEE